MALLVVMVLVVSAVVPTAMAFGAPAADLPAEKNIGDRIVLTNVYFYPGSPGETNKIPISNSPNYPDGVPITDGDYALYFEWQLSDPGGAVENGNWFDVSIDLGLSTIQAKVQEKEGAFAPIIYLGNGATAGSINWINSTNYEGQHITLRLALDDSNFEGLIGDGGENGVKGTGIWGFRYTPGKGGGGNTPVTWQITVGESQSPGGTTTVVPQPPNIPEGGNTSWNPYDIDEPGYGKTGSRLTPDATAAADTIFYWNVFLNGHKHATLEEWANCKNNTDNITTNDDPPLPGGDTFTIVDTGSGIRPTWLRNVTAADGKAVIEPDTPLLINKSAGLFGNGLGEREGPAYLKLFYVNSDVIWQDRIDRADSGYKTPANDGNEGHQPKDGHPVGAYDPYFSTSYLNGGEESALLYAPNFSGSGDKYYNYLTPVPPEHIKSITLTDKGFEVEMYTAALLGDGVTGRTLAIGFMTKAATDAQGTYGQNVSNTVAIKGVNDGNPVAGSSAQVLLGGTVSGGPVSSPNKGKFILEKLELNTTLPMEGIVFDVIAASGDPVLAEAANSAIAELKAENIPSGQLKTGANGKIEIPLPAVPWSGDLVFTITETAPTGFVGVKPFTVTIEKDNRSVFLIETQTGDKKLVVKEADSYGVIVWNKSVTDDKSYYDVALRKWVKKVERSGAEGPETVYFRNEPNTDTPGVMNGDRVLFRIDIYNQSRNFTQVTKITDYLPRGLKFDPAATVQNPDDPATPYTNGLWQRKAGTENILEYSGPPLTFHDQAADGKGYVPEERLPLILTVDIPEDAEEGNLLTNIAEVSEIKDVGGNPVDDIDSTPDADMGNDGATPGIDYGNTPPNGTVVDNEIDQHRINEDGEPDLAADEDDHDYAQVRLPKLIACEVDKDTIRRTSAAYESLPGEEGWNNIGTELFRYDVNARSTSILAADAFNIDDPLQNVAQDQIRLVSLWTPIAWGDANGLFNVWYQTNLTDLTKDYSDVRATTMDFNVKDLPAEMKWLANTGYQLWASNLKTTERTRLDVAALPLAEGEYITALRFEYGAVHPGFTTKKDAIPSLNGERRDANGTLDDELRQIAVLEENKAAPAAEPAPAEEQSFGAKLLSALGLGGNKTNPAPADATVGSAAGGTATLSFSELDALAVTPATGSNIVDWTPKNGDPFYGPAQIEEIANTTLAPASYLVKAVRPMQTEDITATAVSRIAKKSADTGGWMQDADEDGVITKEVVTFALEGDIFDAPARVSSSYVDNIPRLAESEKPAGSGVVRTYDGMQVWLWGGIAVIASVALLFLLHRRGLLRNPLPAMASIRGWHGRHRRRNAR